MNKIKSFSLFESTYNEIEFHEYDNLLNKSIKKFSIRSIQKIERIFNELGNDNLNMKYPHRHIHDDDYGEYYAICTHDVMKFLNGDKLNGKMVMITECDDEWFIVDVSSRTWTNSGVEDHSYQYKCDQLEGVMDLLKIIL